MTKPTPGPWEYVPSNEHHGPYVTTSFGSTVCDCYTMSNPTALSVRNGGNSYPIPFLGEMADLNARLIAEAPAMFALLEAIIAPDGPRGRTPVLRVSEHLDAEARAIVQRVTGGEPI